MKKNNIKNIVLLLTLVFVINLIVPNLALGLNIRYGYFPDVEDSHWAKQVITKMNLRNVVSGYEENGIFHFKPNKPVTQLEAVIMALRTMGLQDKENSVDTGRYLPFSVPDWAKAITIVGVNEGLISGNEFIWNDEASRAWVAQLLVKMLAKEDEIDDVQGEALPYYDSYAIPAEYINYVKVANKYGLIKGNVDNTFKPNDPVTRAQMVAFLSRAEKYLDLKADNLIIGEITEINGENITVANDEGTEYTLVCTISTNMYKDGQEIWLNNLKVNDRVYLIVDGNIVKYLELNPPAPKVKMKVTKGMILQVYPEKNTIVIKTEEGNLETINLQPTTKIVKENDDLTLHINDLAANSEVEINFSNNDEVVKITVLSGIVSLNGEGIIYDIDTKNKIITLEENNQLSAYAYNEETKINIQKNRLASIEDLRVGDKVAVDATDKVIDIITLVAAEVDLTTIGTVKQISLDERIITYETVNRELKAHYLNPNASVDFSGEAGTISDIEVGDKVEVTIKNGNISSLSITNRKLHEGLKGTVVGVDYTNRILTIKNNTNELKAYEVDTNAEIVVNDDDNSYLHEVKKDMQIELEVDDEKITYLAAKNTLLATVVRVNDRTNTLEVTLDNGENKLYSVDEDVDIDIEDEGSPDLDDLTNGDVVEIRVENGKVTDIAVQRIITYKIIDKYSNNSSRVEVLDKDNDDKNLYIYSRVELVIPGQTNPSVRDLQINDIIKATYLGYSLQKVEVAPLVIGNVTSIDAVNKTVRIDGFDGESYSYKFDNYSYVSKNGYSYNNLNLLSTGDRVAVEENLDGGRVFNVMTKVSGKVGAIYKDKTRIYLQITQTNWKKYDMVITAYLHQGPVELTPLDFKLNDNVDIYLANDKVYEVEKK